MMRRRCRKQGTGTTGRTRIGGATEIARTWADRTPNQALHMVHTNTTSHAHVSLHTWHHANCTQKSLSLCLSEFFFFGNKKWTWADSVCVRHAVISCHLPFSSLRLAF